MCRWWPRAICCSIVAKPMARRSWSRLNLGAEPISLSSDAIGLDGEILLSTHMDRDAEPVDGSLDLRGNEGVVIGERMLQAG